MAKRAKDRVGTQPPERHLVAPILGAAGGAIVVALAVEKLKIRRPIAAFGSAAVSLIAARQTTGAARAALEAAGIAAVCVGVTELLARLRKPTAQPPTVRQAAPAPNAVTPEELRNALATIKAKHETEIAQREQEHQETMHSLLMELRGTQRAKKQRVPVVDLSSEGSPDPELVAARMAEISPMLEEDERRRWSAMSASMPRERLAQIHRELLRVTPADGVALLRSSVLPSRGRLLS